jgi:hypothetical protein
MTTRSKYRCFSLSTLVIFSLMSGFPVPPLSPALPPCLDAGARDCTQRSLSQHQMGEVLVQATQVLLSQAHALETAAVTDRADMRPGGRALTCAAWAATIREGRRDTRLL